MERIYTEVKDRSGSVGVQNNNTVLSPTGNLLETESRDVQNLYNLRNWVIQGKTL